jgi:cytochrome bd-type quinol oxidase subunit 1
MPDIRKSNIRSPDFINGHGDRSTLIDRPPDRPRGGQSPADHDSLSAHATSARALSFGPVDVLIFVLWAICGATIYLAIFIGLTSLALFFLWRRTLFSQRWLLWMLMLASPFPFIANTVGWMTAETGRQPWVVYGVLRTANASSENVSSGNVGFTLLGFMGLYALFALIFFALLMRIVPAHFSKYNRKRVRK